jgi:hypothetical protein
MEFMARVAGNLAKLANQRRGQDSIPLNLAQLV